MALSPLASEAHERGLVGAVLSDPAVMLVCRDRLTPRHFTLANARDLWPVFCERHDAGLQIHIGHAIDALEKLGAQDAASWLHGCCDFHVDELYLDPEHMVSVLEERRCRRLLTRAGKQLVGKAKTFKGDARDLLSVAQGWLEGLDVRSNGPLVRPLDSALAELKARLWEQHESDSLVTLLPEVDRVLHMRRGQLGIVEGRTKEGKSAIAQQIQEANALLGRKVALRSLEMTRGELMERAVAQVEGVPLEALARRDLFEELVDTAFARIGKLPWIVEDAGRDDPASILGWLTRVHAIAGLDLAVIDQASLVAYDGDNLRIAMSDFGRRLKRWAVEKGVLVILVSQLTDPVPGAKILRPQLGQTRDCRDLEMHADWVLAVHRPGRWATKDELAARPELGKAAEVGILAQRNGWCGWLEDLIWDGPTMRYLPWGVATARHHVVE